jgi:glycopeptide antibiotics resistance protein
MTKEKLTDNSFGIAGVILGILSVLSLNIVGIVLGFIGLTFSRKQNKIAKNKWSKYGMVLNVIGIVVGVVLLVVLINFLKDGASQLVQPVGY